MNRRDSCAPPARRAPRRGRGDLVAARIGIDEFAAAATGRPAEPAIERAQLVSTPTATFAELAAALAGSPGDLPDADVVLDVRTNNEWRASHVEGTVHIPLYELAHRLAKIPPGSVWVHCGSGYRATGAASLLESAGRTAVIVDDAFATASASVVPLATAA